ncbi:pumilio homology domain family member 4 [Monosporozyma servazzii]
MVNKKNTKSKVNTPITTGADATTGINAALDQLHLDVVDSAKVTENATNVPTSLDKNTFVPTAMDHVPNGPPPMMGMNFPYTQMMNLPQHQQSSFIPMSDFPNANGNNLTLMSNGVGHPIDAHMETHVFPNMPGPDGSNMNPYNMMPIPPLMPPSNDPSLVHIWPGSNIPLNHPTMGLQGNDSSAIEEGINSKTPGAATIGIRRKTFHAISTKDFMDNTNSCMAPSTTENDGSTTNPADESILKNNTTSLGVTSNVGAKTRTMSSSAGPSEHDGIFLPPANSVELTGKPLTKADNKPDSEKLKDMNNPNTYAAAYPYGGPLLQNNPLMGEGGNMTPPYPGVMHSPFPGNFDFGSPFQGFSPILGGPTPPLHGQSPIPPMGPSPLPMRSVPDMGGVPKTEDGKDHGEAGNLNAENANGMPFQFQMMQQAHNGSPPPWLYGNPGFNPMMGSPHNPHSHPHGHMHMMGGNHGKGYTRNNNGERGYFKGKNRNNDPNYYNNDNRRKIEDDSRFADASLDDYVGNIYSLCKDQYGCRFLQKQLDVGGKEAADIIFEETKDHTIELMTDSFGNYLIQKLIERVTLEQRKELSTIAAPFFVDIALNAHGTRALQKLIECVDTPEEAQIIVNNLSSSIVTLSRDLNGNHVVQKCLQKLKPSDFQFIFDTACENSLEIATHRHGCCVLQRCLDFGSKEQCQKLCDGLLSNINKLTLDPFGNYVVQYIINKESEKKDYDYTYKIVNLLKPKITELSLHKFGSNVVEKVLRTPIVSETMIIELLNNGGEKDIQILLNDSYGNYVLQTALDICHKQNEYLYEKFSNIITPLLVGPIRNTPHGKRIASMLNLAKPTQA